MTHTYCTAVECYSNRRRILVVWQAVVVVRMTGMVDTVPMFAEAAGMVDCIQMQAVVDMDCIAVRIVAPLLLHMDYKGTTGHSSNQMLAVRNWQVHRIGLEIDLDSVVNCLLLLRPHRLAYSVLT